MMSEKIFRHEFCGFEFSEFDFASQNIDMKEVDFV